MRDELHAARVGLGNGQSRSGAAATEPCVNFSGVSVESKPYTVILPCLEIAYSDRFLAGSRVYFTHVKDYAGDDAAFAIDGACHIFAVFLGGGNLRTYHNAATEIGHFADDATL